MLTPSGHRRRPVTAVTFTSPDDSDDDDSLAAFICAIFGMRQSGKRTESVKKRYDFYIHVERYTDCQTFVMQINQLTSITPVLYFCAESCRTIDI